MPPIRKAIVLFSGGLDSTTALAIARSEGFEPLALIFRYGQRHAVEVEAAAALAGALGVEHRVQEIDLRSMGGSALTSDAIDVPRDRPEEEIGRGPIPPTYVPARNTIFLSFALGWAEVLGARDIFLGVNALDYSGYPDCRPEYIEAFERLASLACRAAVEGGARFKIHTPLIRFTKAEIIRRGVALGVDYSRTWSCYAPVFRTGRPPAACGRCDSCQLRRKGFREAGVPDPTAYA
ncbi:MAG: 7-cyano-7-deazaguanine synthase QueC [Planctomycetes bacterium]|nr:7-cyano-7-deazaguanine synthase QueC [Planctomycetota bacterium]